MNRGVEGTGSENAKCFVLARRLKYKLTSLISRKSIEENGSHALGLYVDSDAISMPAGFRRHLVGKTLINVFHCDSAEIHFVDKIVIIQTVS